VIYNHAMSQIDETNQRRGWASIVETRPVPVVRSQARRPKNAGR
jgi:hypothetical protein